MTDTPKAAPARNQRQPTGPVVSDKMDKTITVLFDRNVLHTVVGTAVRRTNKYNPHNEETAAKAGDNAQQGDGRRR